jgi:hypothetical protein
MRLRLATFLLALPLAACSGPAAPQEAGVCWRAHQGPAGAASFTPLARGVDTLEACAVLLEALRLKGEPQADGAYQGYFIFVRPEAMSSALHAGGVRYPIFQPPQRAVLDRQIRSIMAEHGGRMPEASEFRLEHSGP